MNESRWPRWVFEEGSEPDPRFTLANERTFLAWTRTSMALLAAGVVTAEIIDSISTGPRTVIAVALLASGMLCAMVAWWRWATTERAMRNSKPLPGSGPLVVLTALLVLAAGTLIVIVVH